MNDSLAELRKLRLDGVRLLGEGNWRTLWRYGKVIGGTDSGRYVSSLSFDVVRSLLECLSSHEPIPICLMNEPDDALANVVALSLVDGQFVKL